MNNSRPRTAPPLTKVSPPTNERIRDLLNDLVGALNKIPTIMELNDLQPGAEAVLLDMILHGERYLLIRSALQTNQPGTLSPRELEIARMVAKGYSNKTIADVLDISSWTVDTHLRRIFAKMGVRTRASMVAHMLEGEGQAVPEERVKVKVKESVNSRRYT